jgi:cell division protein ZapA (FtsZ GTPase activity inhibitor)
MSRQSVAVRIAGHEYKILTDGDTDHLRQIAREVDNAMDRVRDRTGTVDSLDVAVLTCLNLAREIIDLRNQSKGIAEQPRVRDLIERVETLLSERTAIPEPKQDVDRGDQPAATESEPARTLDLSSFEMLRDRSNAAADDEVKSTNASMPAPRVAAGGRDRAS